MTEYFDIRCGDDMDPFARDVPPLEVLAQDVYHWLITNKFALLRDPDWGRGLEGLLGRQLSPTEAGDIEADAREEFSDRIADAKCTIAPIPGEQDAYRMDLQLQATEGFIAIALKLSPDGVVRVA